MAPMLLVSLGLHGLFLLIPVASSDEAAVPAPDPDKDSIRITRVPPNQASESEEVAAVPPAAAPPQSSASRTTASQPAAAARRPAPASPSPRTSSEPSRDLPDLSENSSSTVESPNPEAPRVDSRVDPPAMVITPMPAEEARELLASLHASDRITRVVDQLKSSLDRRYGYDPANISRDAFSNNEQQWINALKQSLGRSTLEPEIYRPDIEITHTQRVCLIPEPWDTPVIGFVLNPDGTLEGEPAILRSTGYGLLDQKAVNALKPESLEAPETQTAYTVQVEIIVDYGRYDCLQLKPPEISRRLHEATEATRNSG